jgi:hypothetical protein
MHLDFICNNAELQNMQNYCILERVEVLMQTILPSNPQKWDLIKSRIIIVKQNLNLFNFILKNLQ